MGTVARGAVVIRCEVCEGPATMVCSGLDVPELAFCEEHGREHEAECPDIARGAAWMSEVAQ